MEEYIKLKGRYIIENYGYIKNYYNTYFEVIYNDVDVVRFYISYDGYCNYVSANNNEIAKFYDFEEAKKACIGFSNDFVRTILENKVRTKIIEI